MAKMYLIHLNVPFFVTNVKTEFQGFAKKKSVTKKGTFFCYNPKTDFLSIKTKRYKILKT